MKNIEYKSSQSAFIALMIFDVIMICPTFGIWSIMLLIHIIQYQKPVLTLEKHAFMFRQGWLIKKKHEVLYNSVTSVSTQNGLFGGQLIVYTTGNKSGYKISGLENPDEVKNEIYERINK